MVLHLVIFKILYLDFTIISDGEKSLSFIIIGGLILLLSRYYNLHKVKKKKVSSNTH